MKKLISVLLVSMLLLTACSAKTEINPETQSKDQQNETPAADEHLYTVDDLKSGVKVSEHFTLKDFQSGNMGPESIQFTLEGNDFVRGTLSSQVEGYYHFKFDDSIFDKNVLVEDINNPDGLSEVNINEGWNYYGIDPSELRLGEDILIYLSNGGELKAQGLVKAVSYEENPMESMRMSVITEFKIDEKELQKIYGTKSSGLDFENETLYSLDEEVYIDYSKYELVIVPMQNTVNEMGTTPQVVTFSEENATRSLVTIFGELNDVKMTYTPNGLDSSIEPVEKYIGTLKDTRLFVDAYMATDFAIVALEGTFLDHNKNVHNIVVGLDDARDPESYEIIMK